LPGNADPIEGTSNLQCVGIAEEEECTDGPGGACLWRLPSIATNDKGCCLAVGAGGFCTVGDGTGSHIILVVMILPGYDSLSLTFQRQTMLEAVVSSTLGIDPSRVVTTTVSDGEKGLRVVMELIGFDTKSEAEEGLSALMHEIDSGRVEEAAKTYSLVTGKIEAPITDVKLSDDGTLQSPSDDNSDSGSSSSSSRMIIIGAAGGLGVVVLVGCVVFIKMRRGRSRTSPYTTTSTFVLPAFNAPPSSTPQQGESTSDPDAL
jgi:hypothetical protein